MEVLNSSLPTPKIGDKLQVLVGDQVPTDGIIIEGSAALDEASITGEVFRRKNKRRSCFWKYH